MTNIKVANGIKALSRKELEECFVKSLHREHEAIHRANNLEQENNQLKEQRQELINILKIIRKDINFVELCDGYLIENKLNELEGNDE